MSKGLTVGSCGKAHGIKGEIAVFTDAPEVFVPGATILTDDGSLTVTSSRPHKNHLIIGFETVSDRNTAESMRNISLSVPVDQLPSLGEDEYWTSSLIGRSVRDLSGDPVGEVKAVAIGPQDRLVISTPNGDIELPFVSDLVPEVAADYIVIDPPEGLTD